MRVLLIDCGGRLPPRLPAVLAARGFEPLPIASPGDAVLVAGARQIDAALVGYGADDDAFTWLCDTLQRQAQAISASLPIWVVAPEDWRRTRQELGITGVFRHASPSEIVKTIERVLRWKSGGRSAAAPDPARPKRDTRIALNNDTN